MKDAKQKKLERLEKELDELKKRMVKTLKKSNEIFDVGGDGWHDNPAYDMMNADIDKIGGLIDEVKDEIAAVKRASKSHEEEKKK
jgi:cob(I)alamin adenosyltransferase